MRRKPGPELIAFIRDHCAGTRSKVLADMVNERFGTDYTDSQIRGLMKNRGLSSGLPQGLRHGEAPRKFTDEIAAFILANYKGTGHVRMADLVNTKFGADFTRGQIKGFYGRNHLNSGLTGCFSKGHVPTNKGRHWDEYLSPAKQENCRKNQFRPAHLPRNTKPIGYERVNQDGYTEVKVRLRPSRPDCNDNFVLKHRLIWEQAHGPIPEGGIVIFLDGDKTNFALDNLKLITRAQHMVLNHCGFRSGPEFIETSLLLAELASAKNRRVTQRRKQRMRGKEKG